MINNSILKNIRMIAIENSYSQSIDWYLEQACRYYSKTYHTPLAQVKSMNPLEVLQIFMEDECLAMEPETRLAFKEKLSPPYKPMLDLDQYDEENEMEELDDDEWVAKQIADIASKEKKQDQPVEQKPADINKVAESVKNLYNQLNITPPNELEGAIKFGKDE